MLCRHEYRLEFETEWLRLGAISAVAAGSAAAASADPASPEIEVLFMPASDASRLARNSLKGIETDSGADEGMVSGSNGLAASDGDDGGALGEKADE